MNDTHDAQRYGIWLAGRLAGYADYIDSGGVRRFTSTVTFPEFAGSGLATHLIRAALDETRDEGLAVVAQCPFVARFIEQHPEYQDLLARPAAA